MHTPPPWFEGFIAAHHTVAGGDGLPVKLFVRTGGRTDGPPLLLLHGFPQSHVMWHRVAQQLAPHFHLVLPDLRGYGRSDKPAGTARHGNYSKRTMAADMVALMSQLGHARFALAAHDRGARVAHRLALDHPQALTQLALVDIAPTLDMYEATNFQFARAYDHWFHLIQPFPLPEKMLGGCARDYLHSKLGGWGAAGTGYIEARALAEYEAHFCTPEAIHAACEDYRASAGIDLEHDRVSRAAGQRIACELLVLWGERGVVQRLFDPLALWRAQCAANVHGLALPAGHFVPEEAPAATAATLLDFFSRAQDAATGEHPPSR